MPDGSESSASEQPPASEPLPEPQPAPVPEPPSAPAPEPKDVLLDLTFGPGWARRPASEGPARAAEQDRRPDRPERPRPDRGGPRGPGDRGRPPGPGGGRPPLRRAGGRPGDRPGRPESREERRPEAPPPVPLPTDLEIEFVPERRGLAPLAHRFARSSRAYSLFEVSALFLSKPEFYCVRVAATAPAGTLPRTLYQCQECKAVFLDEAAAGVHGFHKHFDKFCRKEEQEQEPPKGSFPCVARCGLSGEILGPPNYHGFNDRVAELHRRRFAHMPLEDYRRRLENVHDAALVEQWKEQMRKGTVYHFGPPEAQVTFNRFADAEQHFRQHCLPGLVKAGSHFVMPGAAVAELDDPVLGRVVREAQQKEQRFPLRLSIAVRLAFRHLGLHAFRTQDGGTFVTGVLPAAPMEATQAVPLVREILEQVAAKPGVSVQELLELLRPGSAPDSPEAAAVMTQFRWLVEKGHVIEFSDARLALPATTVAKVQHARGHGPHHAHAKH